MSIREAVYTGSLMVGLGVGVLVARQLGVHSIIGLIGGVVLGAGAGYLAEQAYLKSKSNRNDDWN